LIEWEGPAGAVSPAAALKPQAQKRAVQYSADRSKSPARSLRFSEVWNESVPIQ